MQNESLKNIMLAYNTEIISSEILALYSHNTSSESDVDSWKREMIWKAYA